MRKMIGWLPGAGILRNDNPKGPWGNGSGGGSGGDGSGPRNPWAFPPEGRRPKSGATSLDEFLKRARRNGGGGLKTPGGPALWWIGGALIVGLWILLSSVHSVGPQQRGVATLFGRYYSTLTPGVQFTLPAPLMQVELVDVERNREEVFPTNATENLMLTGDQNIVDLSYQVRWNIKDPEAYVFQIARPEETVRATAESAMRASVATVSLNQAIGAGRAAIEVDVQRRMQAMLDEYGSGVEVLGVAIKQANPPAAVDEDFKAVTAAQQEAQSNLNRARAYAQQVIARAQGDAAEFDKIYEQYRLAPDVTRRRLYYETMEEVLARSNKTIVETPGVTPYLPLPEIQRRNNAPPPAAQADAPATPEGGR
ncbi:protease modulator HflK [Sphingomonas sp. SFZ2018-12]|uniref:protease modulator HflK n=1 Tax=Sphingomonas sp. SFZ2018-12 TaxID=2683197 RepID=UPI0008345D88|nr:protease modulator HflK [Sphingomonas sp. SFZ2018-12]MCH4893816.1 protease modulator HflK [Sphingomonas sp. SFZ2018-12]